MSRAETGVDVTRLVREYTTEELVRMFPEHLDAAIEEAEANDRQAFAAACRDAKRRYLGGGARAE